MNKQPIQNQTEIYQNFIATWPPFIWIVLMVVAICGSTISRAQDCPTIGATWTILDEDRLQRYFTNGLGVECCLHTLSVRVIYTLDGGDYVDVHGAIIRNDSTGVESGDTTLTIYAFGHEQAVARVGGPGTAGPGPNTLVRVMATDVGGVLGGTCNGMYGSGTYCNAGNVLVIDNGSVSMRLSFGQSSLLDGPDVHKGLLWTREELPSPLLTSPRSLNYALPEDSNVDVVRQEDLTLRQLRGEDGLLDIVPIDAFGYELRLYAPEAITGWNGDTYEVDAPPHYFWKVFNPDREPSNERLRIEEHVLGMGEDTPPITHEYVWSEPDQAWTLTKGDGLTQDRKHVRWNEDRTRKTELQEILDPKTGEVVRRIQRIYGKPFPNDGRMVLLSEIKNPGPEEERTERVYISDPNAAGYGHLKSVIYPDGNWHIYEYDKQGRRIREYGPWLNQAPTTDVTKARVIHFSYKAPTGSFDTGHESARPRLILETIQGKEVTRTYHLYSETEHWEIRCAQEGAEWNDPSNLVTKTFRIFDGVFKNELTRIEYPDGTVTLYEHAIEGEHRIRTVMSGVLDEKSEKITQGTRTLSIRGAAGEDLEHRVEDIGTDEIKDRIVFSEHDAFHRPERKDFLDGTYEKIVHGCCGPEQRRDRQGRWTNIVYDALKRPIYEITSKEMKVNRFNAAGDLLRVERLNKNTQDLETLEENEYDLRGKKRRIMDRGRNTQTNFSSDLLVSTDIQADGETRSEHTARDGQLLEISGSAVHGVRFEYAIERDGPHWARTTKKIKLDDNGRETQEWNKTFRDMLDRRYKTERADGATNMIVYNHLGQRVAETDSDGVTVLYAFDNQGRQTERATDMNRNGRIDYAGPDRIQRTEYDDVLIKGVLYHRTRHYQWQEQESSKPTLVSENLVSGNGLIQQQTLYPSRTKWQSTTTWQETDPDNPRRIETTVHPDKTETIRTFEQDLLISEKRQDPNGIRITRVDYRYDDQNRLVAQTDAFAGTTEYEYDAQGRKTAIIQPAPEPGAERPVTRYVYDVMDRLLTTTRPDGSQVHHSYWPTGEIKQIWGSRQYPVAYGYDYAGRKTSMTTWQDFEHDEGKALTRWIYDPKSGELVAKRFQDNQGPDYNYTNAGRLKERIWARGLRTEYKYNNAGELVLVDYQDQITPDIRYQHDRAGRRVEVDQGGDYQQTMQYDNLGKMTGTKVVQPGLKPQMLMRHFDWAGRPSGYKWNDGTNEMNVNYGYNAAGQLSRVTDGSHEVTYDYLANSPHIEKVEFRTHGQEMMRTKKTRDRLGRLLSTTTHRTRDGSLLSSHDYSYNLANQRVSVEGASGESWAYEYDPIGQLVSGERTNNSGALIDQYTYLFDDIGNRQKVMESGKDTDYETNLLNQYKSSKTRSKPNRVTRFRHDPDGNLLEDATWRYEWNGENRLVAMEAKDASKRLEFRYDPQGRRIRKNFFESLKRKKGWKEASVIHFVYDGWNILAELDADGRLLRNHLWGLDVSGSLQGAGGVGGLIASRNYQEETSAYALYDGNGNVVQYVDVDESVALWSMEYDPSGKLTNGGQVKEAMKHMPFGFSTKYVDVETGYNNYGLRHFDPKLNRWLSRDPSEEEGGNNLYGFVENDPINNLDIIGLYTLQWKGAWIQSEKNKVTNAINSARSAAVRIIGEVNELLQERIGNCGCANEKLNQLKNLMIALRNDIDSGNNLEIYHNTMASSIVATAWKSPVPWLYDDELKLNDNMNWGGYQGDSLNFPKLGEVVFHELSHLVGTDDGESGDPWNNAHTLEILFDNPVEGFSHFKAAAKGIGCE